MTRKNPIGIHAAWCSVNSRLYSFQRGLCMPCNQTGCGFMGFHADRVKPATRDGRTQFYLKTGDLSPFCRKHV